MSVITALKEIPENVVEQLEQLMNVDVSLFMAIVDSLPVIIFMVGMGFVIKMAHGRIKPFYFALLSGGVFTSFFGGLLKCIWKVCCSFGYNYTSLTVSFQIYQAIGFALIAFAMVMFVISDKKSLLGETTTTAIKTNASAVGILLTFVPIVYTSVKAGFVWFILMAVFTVAYLVCLAIVAFRRKMVWQGILFFVSMVLMFTMVALSKKFEDPTSPFAKFNWIAQCVNILTQVCMALPAYLLSKKFTQLRSVYVPVEQN